jgi:hypothetical protein
MRKLFSIAAVLLGLGGSLWPQSLPYGQNTPAHSMAAHNIGEAFSEFSTEPRFPYLQLFY